MQKDSNFLVSDRLERLMAVFSTLFSRDYNTRLQGGGAEPYYQAATATQPFNIIVYTRDYVSSALHEVAHWCVAGEERRQRDDYGYWYEPDGRSAAQQAEFERVEVAPQAMERVFSFAAGQQFRVSADNLHGDNGASESFVQAIHRQTLNYCAKGLPKRADAFARTLALEFGRPNPYSQQHYTLDQLR